MYTKMQTLLLLPQARGSFNFSKACCHIHRFLLLSSGVISICKLLKLRGLLCSTDRENIVFVPSHGHPSLKTMLVLTFFLVPSFP